MMARSSGLSRRQMIGFVSAASLAAVAAPALAARPAHATAAFAGQQTASAPLVVPNAGFEDAASGGGPAQWTVTGTAAGNAATVVTEQFHGGSHSLKLAHNTAGSLYVRSSQIPVTAGDSYVASVFVLGSSGTAGWVYLEFWNSAGTRLLENHVMPAASASWQQVSVTATAPAGAGYATVLIYGSTSAQGVSYFDDVTLVDSTAAAYDPTLGTASELFVDDYRVAAVTQLARVVHPGERSAVLLAPDQPWESDMSYLYGGTIWDADSRLYRMWYTAIDAAKVVQICYAESRNGTSWTKPKLGLVSYQGSTANNIVISAPAGSACYGVVLDPKDSDAGRRFKMLMYKAGVGYGAYFSPDGKKWAGYAENPVMPGADVANVSYDVTRGQFIATTKQPYNGVRAAFVSTSTDFVTWTAPVLALAADDRDRAFATAHGGTDSQIYGMPAFAYGNAYLALPWIFELTGPGEPGSAGDGTIQPQIAASRDLQKWSRPDRTPLIPLGGAGSWDQGMIFTASAPIVSDHEVLVYYGAWNGTHGTLTRGASIGRASWKPDRFVSFSNAGDYEGVLTTRPLTIAGSTLAVNAALSPHGYLKVELLDPATGQALDGFGIDEAVAIRGDSLASTARWTSQKALRTLAGQQLALRFHVLGGDLYSFRIA